MHVLDGINAFLKKEDADFILVEEVDVHATRSHHIDQAYAIRKALGEGGYSSSFAVNYDSPYLFFPFDEPHGKSLSGMLTMSKYAIKSSVRRSLPIENSLMKLVDLDRCYSVNRIDVEGGGELVIFTVHLSAYTSDGTVATRQLEMLLSDMQAEYEKGNYVIAGGDFNKDLLGSSAEIFGVDGSGQTWAQPIPEELFEGKALSLVAPFDEKKPVPSCRNADAPYHPEQFVLTVDGFIVSDNVEVVYADVVDLGFELSDHNPVKMIFKLGK
jgi:endonuclease/exonuclease/phosphatase family metal-dependent hydrolase